METSRLSMTAYFQTTLSIGNTRGSGRRVLHTPVLLRPADRSTGEGGGLAVFSISLLQIYCKSEGPALPPCWNSPVPVRHAPGSPANYACFAGSFFSIPFNCIFFGGFAHLSGFARNTRVLGMAKLFSPEHYRAGIVFTERSPCQHATRGR